MTTNPLNQRLRVVADLGDETCLDDLQRLEELLLTLRVWAKQAAEPGGDGWTPPGPLAGDAALAALNRIQDVLRPTQTRIVREPATGNRYDVPPDGPRWYAADGRYELAALSFVTVAAADVDLLGAVAPELGRPDCDPDVREAIEDFERDLPQTCDARERERRSVVVTAARIHGLLDLEPTPDTTSLHQARTQAGDNVDRLVLTAAQEAAYHRTVDRITAITTLGDPLTRWAMGARDRS